MLRIAGVAVFASLLVSVHAGRVQAHARLTESVPDAGATLQPPNRNPPTI